MIVKRGEIYLDTDFGTGQGSEQSGRRPCIVISNDMCNRFSPTITVIPITKQMKTELPTHFNMSKAEFKLNGDSIALVEQMRTIDKSRLGVLHSLRLNTHQLHKISEMSKIQLGIYS